MKIDVSDVLILAGLITLAVYIFLFLGLLHLMGGAGVLLLYAGIQRAQRSGGA